MNKFLNYFLMLTAIVAVSFLSSCSDDDETTPDGPSIHLSTSDGEHEEDLSGFVGDTVALEISVNAPSGFNVLRIYKQIDGVKGSPIEEFARVSGVTQTEFDTTYTYEIVEEDVDNAVFLIFEAVDDEATSSTLEYEVTAEEKPTIKYEMKLLYAPNSNLESKTFFSTNDGMTYSVSEVLGTDESVSPKIDFGYFYGETFKATLASPVDYPIDYSLDGWEEMNATKIRRTDLSASAFMELENDVEAINNAFDEAEEGDAPGLVKGLVVGEVLAFELVADKGNKRGLIKINDIEGTTGTDAHITIDVVVVD